MYLAQFLQGQQKLLWLALLRSYEVQFQLISLMQSLQALQLDDDTAADPDFSLGLYAQSHMMKINYLLLLALFYLFCFVRPASQKHTLMQEMIVLLPRQSISRC